METLVLISRNAEKDLRWVPNHIRVLFDAWVETIEFDGLVEMQKLKGYRDHALKGNRKGQRSSSISRSWRVIYQLDERRNVVTVEVLEVNHHDY